MEISNNCVGLTDQELSARLPILASKEREDLATLLVHLEEFDRRKLYREEGCHSIFAYCTGKLHYAEPAAFRRIYAARVLREHPEVAGMLREGRLHLEGLTLLGPRLAGPDGPELLAQAQGKSKRDIERLVCALEPAEPPGDMVRRGTFPVPETAGEITATELDNLVSMPALVASHPLPVPPEPPSGGWVRVAFSAKDEFWLKVERVRALLRYKIPTGKLEEVFTQAIEDCLDRRDPARRLQKRRGTTVSKGAIPTVMSRRVPNHIRREVWRRDGGRCVFVAPGGHRCEATESLEFDHVRPWAMGGKSEADNIRLLCRAHNQMMAETLFGLRR